VLDIVADGCEVLICLPVRRFLCMSSERAKVTFAEQVNGLAIRHVLRTSTVTAVLEAVALAVGGGRLAARVSWIPEVIRKGDEVRRNVDGLR
jgi:hypothetical protein